MLRWFLTERPVQIPSALNLVANFVRSFVESLHRANLEWSGGSILFGTKLRVGWTLPGVWSIPQPRIGVSTIRRCGT